MTKKKFLEGIKNLDALILLEEQRVAELKRHKKILLDQLEHLIKKGIVRKE